MTAAVDDEVVVDPIGVIMRLVCEVEYGLAVAPIGEVVTAAAGGRATRRRLARSLKDNPQVLRTGRPPAIWSTAKVLLALRKDGATDVSAPRCGECMKELRYLRSRRGGDWACTPCADRQEVCAGCGEQRRVVSRDRHGSGRCVHCPDTAGDPLGQLTVLVTDLDPQLSGETVIAALRRATSRPAGAAAAGLGDRGAPGPAHRGRRRGPGSGGAAFHRQPRRGRCRQRRETRLPRCGQVKALSKLLDGHRVCRNCFARSAAVPCCRCGSVREPAARDGDGGPLCPNCLVSDPINLEECATCGRRSRVAVRSLDGPLCVNCVPKQILACGICGRTATCEISRATGKPWCLRCQQWWAACSRCGIIAPIRGGTRQDPLCTRCLNPDPGFWGRCPTCEVTWQLSPRPCQRCILDRKVRGLLADDSGVVRRNLAPLHQALAGIERPDTALTWMSRPKSALAARPGRRR